MKVNWVKRSEKLPDPKANVLVFSPHNMECGTGPISVQKGWIAHNKRNVHDIAYWAEMPDWPEEYK